MNKNTEQMFGIIVDHRASFSTSEGHRVSFVVAPLGEDETIDATLPPQRFMATGQDAVDLDNSVFLDPRTNVLQQGTRVAVSWVPQEEQSPQEGITPKVVFVRNGKSSKRVLPQIPTR